MFQSLADLVAWFENRSGDPTALNYRYDATHTASGLFQVTNSTWDGFGGYPSAASAPADVQRAQFAQMVGQRGLADYTCPGCNAALSNYVAANPDSLNLPIFAASGAAAGGDATTGTAPGAYYGTDTQPGGLLGNGQGWFGTNIGAPAPGSPQAVQGSSLPGGGKPGSLGTAAVGWVDKITGWLASVSTRIGLFVLAIIFIIGALVLFGIKSGVEVQTGGVA